MRKAVITAFLVLSTLGLSATTRNEQLKGIVIENKTKVSMAYVAIEIFNLGTSIMLEVTTGVNGSYPI